MILYGRRLVLMAALLAFGRLLASLPDLSDDVFIDVTVVAMIWGAVALLAFTRLQHVEQRERDAAQH